MHAHVEYVAIMYPYITMYIRFLVPNDDYDVSYTFSVVQTSEKRTSIAQSLIYYGQKFDGLMHSVFYTEVQQKVSGNRQVISTRKSPLTVRLVLTTWNLDTP